MVLSYLKIKTEGFKNSLMKNIFGPNAKWWLFGISFAESSFFPIPPDFYCPSLGIKTLAFRRSL
jgi:membrane protein YqaA with SNARE-associated domain